MSNVLLGGITSTPNVGSPNTSKTGGSATPEFNIHDIFNNGEKGGLFIYNQNVFEDVEGSIPATTEVALICNSLGAERRNLFNFSELETGLNTGNTNSYRASEIQFSEGVNGALLNNDPGMSAGYAYLKARVKAGQVYNLSCEMYGQDGTYSPLGEGNSAQITFGSRTKMGGLSNLQTEDLGDNHYRISGSFTGQIDEENFFGVGKFVNSQTTPTVVSKFQIEEGLNPTEYQHVGNYGAWAGLALYTTFDKSEIFGNELVNHTMVFNDNEDLDSCTIIVQLGNDLSVIEDVDCNGGVFTHSFTRLFIVNRKLTASEMGGVIGYMYNS